MASRFCPNCRHATGETWELECPRCGRATKLVKEELSKTTHKVDTTPKKKGN